MYVFNLKTHTLQKLAPRGPAPPARAGHAAAAVGTQLYVLGGVTDKGYSCDLHVLDTSTNSWSFLGYQNFVSARAYHTLAAYGSMLVVFAGWHPDHGAFRDVCTANSGMYRDDMRGCREGKGTTNEKNDRIENSIPN